LSFEQVSHELISQRSRELRGHDNEIVSMIVEACAQAKAYTDFIGLLATRLCRAIEGYPELFIGEFRKQYEGIERLETNKIRNIGSLFAQLLYTDCVPWDETFRVVVLDENMTTPSSRIFLKVLFQRLAQIMGLDNLRRKLQPSSKFQGLFPRKPARRTTFAVNFFSSIELQALTVEMREWLKDRLAEEEESSSSSSSSTSSSTSSSSSSSFSSKDKQRKRRRTERSTSSRSSSS